MIVGEVAELTGLPPKTLRYYEDIGLVRPARRPNGYRDYSEADIHKLKFLGRARSLGFSIDDCRTLLSLYDDKGRESRDVKAIARSHLKKIDQKIEELRGLHDMLAGLIETCHGDDRPDCPILNDLAGVKESAVKGPKSRD